MIQISQDNHNKSTLELKQRLQQKLQHTIESMMDKNRLTDELKTLKMVHREKVAELEHSWDCAQREVIHRS